jgi:GTP cyclohydrolase IA
MSVALEHGVRTFLKDIGLDPTADDLVNTPGRVAKAWAEMTSGYAQDPSAILTTTFDVPTDGMVIVTGVPFVSLCAHHLLPFEGYADIAYLPSPGARVAGLSKLARLLDCYAMRLQTQEQISTQVTTALDKYLSTDGSACVLTATHGCMAHRGVRKPGSRMVTSSLTGHFRTHEVRQEFLALISR